jgi:hypothetical protein
VSFPLPRCWHGALTGRADQPGPAVVSSYTTAQQGNIVGGQWEQFTPCGTTLYATVIPPAANTTRLQVFWQTTPATNVTWSFQGDAVNANIPGYKQQGSGNFLLCTTAAGVGGTSAAPYLFVNLGAFSYMTPSGCADGVRVLSTPMRYATYECLRRSTTTTVPRLWVGTEHECLGARAVASIHAFSMPWAHSRVRLCHAHVHSSLIACMLSLSVNWLQHIGN